MGKQKVLSSKFNMSLGYIPVIISIILCEFIMQDIAIYIGTGVGLLFSTWLDNYHQHVYEALSPSLDEGEREWLKEACSNLTTNQMCIRDRAEESKCRKHPSAP